MKPQNDRPHTRFHGRVAGSDKPCAHPGCAEPGEFRAPPLEGAGAHDGPPRFRWFCLDHVRAFNAGYNYFDGMTADEIHQAQRPLAGWEGETRAFSKTRMGDQGPRWADFADPLDAIGAKYARTPPRPNGRPLSQEDCRSLDALGLSPDADRSALRKRYSELVRRYHPDRNGGDRTHEAALRKVITAYQHLRRAPAFA
ncbi:J domain-containing protein [uncultured Sphingomonas sp.]|uniref:J domain-containing protein n=1 Tax=uncultured Sphingomonas sp. TaxID=158754 RepID=UPI0030FCAF0B